MPYGLSNIHKRIIKLPNNGFLVYRYLQSIDFNIVSPNRQAFNTLRPRQDGRHFADDIFRCILLNENVWIPNKISLKFVPKGRILNQWWLVHWRIYASPGLNELKQVLCMFDILEVTFTFEM